jgi:cell shape-determining protein MreC
MPFFNYRRAKQNKTKGAFFGVVFLCFITLIAVLGINITRWLGSPLRSIASPVWLNTDKAMSNMGSFFSVFQTKIELKKENQVLIERVGELKAKLNLAERQIKTFFEIEKSVDLRLLNSSQVRTARVIKKSPQIPYDSIIINLGQQAGIKNHDIVMAEGMNAIGKIVSVQRDVSIVGLYSSSGAKTPVLVGKKALSLDALGRGGGVFALQIPRDADIVKGDDVILDTFNPIYLGEVYDLYSSPADPLKIALFRSPVNTFELKWVSVVSQDFKTPDVQKLLDDNMTTSASSSSEEIIKINGVKGDMN